MYNRNRIDSPDIQVDRKAITKVIQSSSDRADVIEINISLCAIPRQQREKWEYEKQVRNISRLASRELRSYVSSNCDIFDDRHILDINFTTANLRKGYNKAVQISLFVRQKGVMKISAIRKRVKEGIKPFVNAITGKIQAEDFMCYKRKQTVNARNR